MMDPAEAEMSGQVQECLSDCDDTPKWKVVADEVPVLGVSREVERGRSRGLRWTRRGS